MPHTPEERTAWFLQAMGCSEEVLRASVNGGGNIGIDPAMLAMSMMSDAQELIARGQAEEARQSLNRAKWVLGQYVRPILRDLPLLTDTVKYLPETTVYDGRYKVWRVLNLNSGTVYSNDHESKEAAAASIEHNTFRAGYIVRRTPFEAIRRVFSATLPERDKR